MHDAATTTRWISVRRRGTERRWRALPLALLAGVMLLTGPALAGGLDDAKSSGAVGEQSDGYLGLVDASAKGKYGALVDEINRKRKERYAEIAHDNGIKVELVAARAGAKLIARTPSGQYVRSASGDWQKKP